MPDPNISGEYKDSEYEVHYHSDRLAEHQYKPLVISVGYDTGKKAEEKLGDHSHGYYKSYLKGGSGQLEDKKRAHDLLHPHCCRMAELSQPHIPVTGIAESPEGTGHFNSLFVREFSFLSIQTRGSIN